MHSASGDQAASVTRLLAPYGSIRGDFTQDIESAWDAVWALVMRGVNDRKSDAHTPSMATNGTNGWPQVRTMVLRGADPGRCILWCHTDARTPKMAEIARDPRASVHLYDQRVKMQLRLAGHAQASHEDVAAQIAWERSRLMSRRGYLATEAPGTPTDEPQSGLPDDLDLRPPRLEETEAGYANFAVVAIAIERIDWLYLGTTGHRRARFACDGRRFEGGWVIP